MSRGLRRLTEMSGTLLKALDAEADKAADELQEAHKRATAAMDAVRTNVVEPIKAAAAETEALLKDITNDPTGRGSSSSGGPA